ncbi:WLM domain-containing protein [Crassisporium funariophilum]|nr:WLM domain-containing protein [Crassisporium funariophilum]
MPSHTTDPISLTVTFRGKHHALLVLPDSTLAALHARLEELTEVPPLLQKLLYKGKKSTRDNDVHETTLVQAGLKDGTKVQMLGSTTHELDGLRAVENENTHRERIMRERALKAPVKLRSTGSGPISSLSSSSSSSLQYRFHELKALEHLPNPSSALALLTKLSEDPAIKHVMQKHKFTVGLLTELAPHEHPGLLGLNENAGQAIKLRLRTDKYDGFRLYNEVRRVLCHELTHNVWGDHDDNFKELNSKLNREVTSFEQSATHGTHYLSGGPRHDTYQPSSELEAEAQTYVLGGGGPSTSTGSLAADSAEDRRRRVLEATMNRLRKEEEELEHSCGTSRSAAT